MKKCKDCFITSCSYRGTDDTECFYQKQKYATEETGHWWQSFRAEAAKDILCVVLDKAISKGDLSSIIQYKQLIHECIVISDELIRQLKEKEEK